MAKEPRANGVVIAGRLIDGTGKPPLERAMIRISDGRIEAIGPQEEFGTDPGPILYNLGDWTITPGLIDSHDHLTIDLGDMQRQAEESDAWLALVGVRNARIILRAGITTLRNMGEKNHIDVSLKRAIESGEIQGPRLVISGQPITRTGGHFWFLGQQADGADDVRQAVREQIKAGADYIKLMVTGGLSTFGTSATTRGFSDAEIRAAIEEAHALGRKIAGHAYGGAATRTAITEGIDSVEHGAYLTEADLTLMAEKGTYLVPTTGVVRVAAAASEGDVPGWMVRKSREAAERHMQVLALARQLGVKLATGTDDRHGKIVDEMRDMLAAGYSEMEAIVAATRNGAELAGVSDQVGVLTPGKYADFIAVAGDPLRDIAAFERIQLVAKAGFARRCDA